MFFLAFMSSSFGRFLHSSVIILTAENFSYSLLSAVFPASHPKLVDAVQNKRSWSKGSIPYSTQFIYQQRSIQLSTLRGEATWETVGCNVNSLVFQILNFIHSAAV